jgi:hypothetical protein
MEPYYIDNNAALEWLIGRDEDIDWHSSKKWIDSINCRSTKKHLNSSERWRFPTWQELSTFCKADYNLPILPIRIWNGEQGENGTQASNVLLKSEEDGAPFSTWVANKDSSEGMRVFAVRTIKISFKEFWKIYKSDNKIRVMSPLGDMAKIPSNHKLLDDWINIRRIYIDDSLEIPGLRDVLMCKTEDEASVWNLEKNFYSTVQCVEKYDFEWHELTNKEIKRYRKIKNIFDSIMKNGITKNIYILKIKNEIGIDIIIDGTHRLCALYMLEKKELLKNILDESKYNVFIFELSSEYINFLFPIEMMKIKKEQTYYQLKHYQLKYNVYPS